MTGVMKNRFCVIKLSIILLLACVGGASAQATGRLTFGINRVEGRVTDSTNNGVNNAYVELYDNLGAVVGRQRTSGQGRFSFRGMGPGRYTVSVKPYGTNLKEETRDIEINNQSSRSDTVMVDIRLQTDDRFQSKYTGIVGTVFVQEVPTDAERLYRSGVDQIVTNRAKGINDLEAAIKMFPKYFNALAALGKAHIIAEKYADGYPYLLRAIDINPRCSDCYYSMALAFYKLDESAAAVKAVDAAVLLKPNDAVIRLMQGMIYRAHRDLSGAEKALLMAKSLYKAPNPEVHWQLSLVYNRLKKNKEAADELEQYLKVKPGINEAEKENVQKLIARLRTSK